MITLTVKARWSFMFTAGVRFIPVPFPFTRVPDGSGQVMSLVSFEPLLQIFNQFFDAPFLPAMVSSKKIEFNNFFSVIIRNLRKHVTLSERRNFGLTFHTTPSISLSLESGL